MSSRRREDRLYTALVLGFLVGLVGLGLLGVPALLVAAIGVVVATLAIVVFQGTVGRRGSGSRSSAGTRVPDRYVPRVLESGSRRRRRMEPLRRHRGASPPLRFR